MKKFPKRIPLNKKLPLELEEHKELSETLRKCSSMLEPWVQRFYIAYSVNGKEVKQLWNVLNLLSSKICCVQDEHWYRIKDEKKENKSPYYGNGKVGR